MDTVWERSRLKRATVDPDGMHTAQGKGEGEGEGEERCCTVFTGEDCQCYRYCGPVPAHSETG